MKIYAKQEPMALVYVLSLVDNPTMKLVQVSALIIINSKYLNRCYEIIAVVPQLLKVIQAPNARDEENVYATESAVAALTKICKFAPDRIELNAILPIWFGALPMLEDYEEAPLTYTFLLSLLNA
jgi:hypothetical protein